MKIKMSVTEAHLKDTKGFFETYEVEAVYQAGQGVSKFMLDRPNKVSNVKISFEVSVSLPYTEKREEPPFKSGDSFVVDFLPYWIEDSEEDK